MRKKSIWMTIATLLRVVVLYYVRLPDYEIYSSISFSSGGNRDTELNVIVYQYWDLDGLAERIKNEHNMINGTPTKLEINVYYSKWHFRKAYPFSTIVYN